MRYGNVKGQKRVGPLHVRPDEEPDVTFVIVKEVEDGCALCGDRGHSHRFCPSNSFRAERYG